jgi:hypothetical protein
LAEVKKKDIWSKLELIDPRIWYWILVIILVIPLIKPLMLPIPISIETRRAFETMENIPPDGAVLFMIGASAGMWPECMPSMVAVLRHMYIKHTKFVIIAGATATDYKLSIEKMFSQAGAPEVYGYKYGVDYAIFGFFPGGETALAGLAKDFRSIYKFDDFGRDIEELPIMKTRNKATDWSAVWTFTSGLDWIWLIRHISIPYKVPVMISVVAPGIPEVAPWFIGGDIAGFLGSTRGGAEYEQLLRIPGTASKNLDAINLGHILLITSVILGNLIFILKHRGEKR